MDLTLLSMAMVCHAAPAPSYELYNYDPVASKNATVVAGNARFTVLTPQLIRMEYSDSGQFEDRATLAILNRNVNVPAFTTKKAGNTLTITTANVVLAYTGGVFTASSLTVKPAAGATGLGAKFSGWHPTKRNDANLLGTIKSLDEVGVESLNCTENNGVHVHGESLHCEWGLVSKDGWSVVDDTENWALTEGAEWWDSKNADTLDWYLFAHGLEYKQAIADYMLVGGKVPVIPRYALGVWFTRWYDFNNVGVKRLVNKYAEKALPLDVYVTDMNWHKKDNWGGFSFDEHLYPFPGDTFGWLHKKGITTAANLHDANGVGNYETMFPEMCKAMGLNPEETTTVPFSIVNKTYVYALEDIVLGNVADKLDFWWIDWQQGGNKGGAAGGKQNPTIWTNKIRVTDPKRQGKSTRAIVLARWGGLGTHRYQVGFSGDVRPMNWDTLAYQPYFSQTAANVAYGFWSHDIEGPGNDPEMYVRWVQWAAFSGVLRSHDRGMSAGSCAGDEPGQGTTPGCSVVKPWDVDNRYYEIVRNAMVTRSSMVPYLYTAARRAHETGLGLLLPMYYENPENKEAYLAKPSGDFAQYYFGSANVIVSPITRPVDNSTNMAQRAVWLPAGEWIEKDTGFLHNAGAPGSSGLMLNKSYDVTEIPVFIKAGTVLPSTPVRVGDTVGLAMRQYVELQFSIYPGTDSGEGVAYEDDAGTDAYLNGAFAETALTYTRSDTAFEATITTTGNYTELPKARRYTLMIVNGVPPTAATANGVDLPYEEDCITSTASGWCFSGEEMTLYLRTPAVSTAAPLKIALTTPAVPDNILSGLKGIFQKTNLAKDSLDEVRLTPGCHAAEGGALMAVSAIGDALSYLAGVDAARFVETVATTYRTMFVKAQAEMTNRTLMSKVSTARAAYANALLANAMN